jgi:hypothetical protein
VRVHAVAQWRSWPEILAGADSDDEHKCKQIIDNTLTTIFHLVALCGYIC